MKKATLLFLILLVYAALSGVAAATTANLYFTGQTATNGGPVGPYTFNINNGSNTLLVCASDHNNIIGGEAWEANVYNIGQMDGVFGATESQWLSASYYAYLLMGDPGNADLQTDVWASVGLDGNAPFPPAPPLSWTAQGVRFYIPIPGTVVPPSDGTTYGLPQPFIQTREPASLSLLGVGLLGLVGALRVKRER